MPDPQPSKEAIDLDAFVALALTRGVIDADTAAALRALHAHGAAPATPAVESPEDAARRRRAQAREREAAERDAALVRLRAEREQAATAALGRRLWRKNEQARRVGVLEALVRAAAGGAPVLEHGAALDAAPGGRLRDEVLPLIYENVGWLIGGVLVLTGSVYGLREAWDVFGPAGRYASVAGALLVYQALFVLLSAVLARRSLRAARFLSGIGACLTPLCFVALARLLAIDLRVGALGAGVVTTGMLLTLGSVGKRFAVGWCLTPALLIPALAMLPCPQLADESPGRLLLPLLALVGPWLLTRWQAARGSLGAYGLALYAALAAELWALSSDATDGPPPELLDPSGIAWRTGGAVFGAWLGSYATGLALVLGATRRLRPDSATKGRILVALSWLALALAATGGTFGPLSALRTDVAVPGRASLLIALAASAVASGQALLLAARFRGAFPVWLGLSSLGCAVACRVALPQPDAAPWWTVAALLPAVTHLRGLRLSRVLAAADAVSAGWAAAVLAVLWWVEPAQAGLYPITLGAALLLAVCCHGQNTVAWHCSGAFVAWLGILVTTWSAADARIPAFALVALAVVHGLVARVARQDALRNSLDDASLGGLLVAGALALRPWLATGFSVWPLGTGLAYDARLLPDTAPLLAASAALLVRAFLDQSALPALCGTLGLAAAATWLWGPASYGATALFLGAAALGAGALGALLTPRTRAPVLGRSVLERFELPWAWRGLGALGQGLGLGALPLAAAALAMNALWFGARADRNLALAGGVCVVATCLVGFLGRSWNTFALRGRAGVLWALLVAAAVTAVTNRIGRPLPPELVARNLSLVGVALWLVALGLRRSGPWLASKLGAAERQGGRYHHIPLFGVMALAAMLCADVWLLTPLPLYRGLLVIPPLMLFGPALLWALVGRWLHEPVPKAAAVPLCALGAALWMAQGHLLGPTLAQAGAGGPWVLPAAANAPGAWLLLESYLPAVELPALFGRALTGLGLAAVGFAALAHAFQRLVPLPAGLARILGGGRRAKAQELTAACGLAATLLVLAIALSGWVTTDVTAAGTALAAGLGIATLRTADTGRSLLRAPFLLAVALLVHTLAQRAALVPDWAGPVLTGLALATVLLSHRALHRAWQREGHLTLTHGFAAVLAAAGLAYALARGGTSLRLSEGATVLANAGDGLTRLGSDPLPAFTAWLAAAAAIAAAWSWNTLAHRRPTQLATHVAAALATAGGAVLLVWKLALYGPAILVLIATALAAVVVLAHGGRRVLGPDQADLAAALRATRDVAIVGIGALIALALPQGATFASPWVLPLAVSTLAAVFLVSVHAVFQDQTGRPVYFAQTALLGAYWVVRKALWQTLLPEHDALVFLGLGAVLIGVTAVARRTGADAVAKATRRFAALLPLLTGVVLPWVATGENAWFALGSSAFYSALGWVEGSRVFGTFGAVAANLALLLLSLSQGLDGFDVYLAPLGLLLLVVVHLFAADIAAHARMALRFLGTGLTYAPSALAIVLQVGNAESDWYPLGFAAACVVGVAVGMWLHIRAYLVLGVAFLLLDLGTGLVRASLRNQQLGFVVLSLAGLAILGGMVGYTLHKAKVLAVLRRLRGALATWD